MKDPKKFAKGKLEKGSPKSDDVSTRKPSDKHLAAKIFAHNRKKLHKAELEKSLDFKETLVSVDSGDQLLAEATTNKELLDYVQKNASDGAKIPFPTGTLTLSQREPGLFHGYFSDRDGQIVEKFDSQTVAVIAKNLQLKSLVPTPVKSMDANYVASEPAPSVPASEQTIQMIAAAHDRVDMVQSRIDELQRQLIEQQRGKSIKIKYGDFELEIRKSVQEFVNDFKTGRAAPEKDVVRKAITSWRKKHAEYIQMPSDQSAARELLENWEQHEDSFCQFVDALSRGEDEQR